MVTLIPIIGGLASGFVGGILTVEVRARREKRITERQWYDRTTRLAQRVIRANQSTYSEQEAVYARNTCAGVLGNLTSHIMDAPPHVTDEMLEAGDELASALQTVTWRDVIDAEGYIPKDMEEASQAAEVVVEKAEQERTTVPLL